MILPGEAAETSEYEKPLPQPTSASRAYWDAAQRHELRMPRCDDCGNWVIPISAMCQHCGGERLSWELVSERAVVSGVAIYRRAFDPSFAADIPYAVVQVDLESGHRLTSNVVGPPAEDVHVGDIVTAHFEDVSPDFTLVKFRPA